MRKISVIFLIAFCLLSIAYYTRAADPCVSHIVIPHFGEYSNYYTACNAEMRTTFSWRRGYGKPRVLCGVDGTTFSQWYSISAMPPGSSGEVVEWTHCANLNNHRAYMTFEPYIEPPTPGFIDGTTFTVDYFASQQQ